MPLLLPLRLPAHWSPPPTQFTQGPSLWAWGPRTLRTLASSWAPPVAHSPAQPPPVLGSQEDLHPGFPSSFALSVLSPHPPLCFLLPAVTPKWGPSGPQPGGARPVSAAAHQPERAPASSPRLQAHLSPPVSVRDAYGTSSLSSSSNSGSCSARTAAPSPR